MSYCRTNQKDRGEAMFKHLLEIKPGFCHSYSLWLQEEGRFEESVSLLHRWLELEPIQGMAYFCLAEAKSFPVRARQRPLSKRRPPFSIPRDSNRLIRCTFPTHWAGPRTG